MFTSSACQENIIQPCLQHIWERIILSHRLYVLQLQYDECIHKKEKTVDTHVFDR